MKPMGNWPNKLLKLRDIVWNIEKHIEQTAKIEEERNAQLAGLGADQGQKDAVNKIANDALEKAQAQNIKLLEQESSTRLDTISKLSQQASTSGQSLQVEKDLNKGKKLTRDQDNIIRRDSLQANGELISIFEALKTAGVSERDAMIRITQSLDGATSAAKQFSETLKNQSKAVGGIFRQLFTGPLEDSFKVAQKLNDAMDVAEGGQSISGLGRERGNAAADAFGQFMSIGAVTGEQTDAAFKGAIPESAYKGLQDALTRKITSEDPTGSPEVIAEKVQEGMRKAAEGFFGADVVQNEIKDANLRTAKAVETLATQKEGEQSATPAKPLTNVPRADSSFPDALAVKALGGMIYANEGTLVNFQPKGTDTVPAMLTPGEFVMKRSAVDKYGPGMMKDINAGNYADGGRVQDNNRYVGSYGRSDFKTGQALGKKTGTFKEIAAERKKLAEKRYDEDKLKMLLAYFDADGDGKISSEEETAYLKNKSAELDFYMRGMQAPGAPTNQLKKSRVKALLDIMWPMENPQDGFYTERDYENYIDHKSGNESRAVRASKNATRQNKQAIKNQPFSEKWAGPLTFIEREFRPFATGATAGFKGIVGAGQAGIGYAFDNELYKGMGEQNLNVASAAGSSFLYDVSGQATRDALGGRSIDEAFSGGPGGSEAEKRNQRLIQEEEKRSKFVSQNLDSDLAMVDAGANIVGELALGASLDSPVAAFKAVTKIAGTGAKIVGRGAQILTTGTKAATAGGKVTKVTAAVEELAKIDKVIKADAATLKILKKTLKKERFSLKDTPLGSEPPNISILKKRIKNIESGIDSMKVSRQTRLGELDELKRIEQGSLSTISGGKKTDDVVGKLDDSLKAGKTDDIAKATDDLAKSGKADDLVKATDDALNDSTKKRGVLRRLGGWLLGRAKAGTKRVVTGVWDLKKLGILGSQAIRNPGFMSWVDGLFSGGPATSEAAADAQATDALEGAGGGDGGAGAGAGAAAAGPPEQENIAQRLREELYKEYNAIKYPTIGARFIDEDASDKAGKDFGLGSDAATKWLYNKWKEDEIGEEGFSSQYLINNVGQFRKEARKYRTEKVNSMSREDKKAYLNARIYGKSQYGEGMASQGYQHTFAGTVGDAENEKRTVLAPDGTRRGIGVAMEANSGAMTGAAIAPGGIGAAIGATIGAGISAIKPEMGGSLDKLIGLLDEKPEGFYTGGYVNGPPGRDVIPAYLSRGEFVMRSSAVNNIGRDNLTKMNAQNFYNGGDVGKPETSTMNPMKIEGGKELLEAGRILKDAAKTIPTMINMTVDQLPAVDANIKIDGGQIVGTIKSAVEEWVGAELDTRFRDYELKQQSGGG